MLAWRDSPVFKRVVSFCGKYPEDSLQSDEVRALLHHLVVMRRPERVLEIGTWHAGTTETMARALWETNQGRVDTIDPFSGEGCPTIIASFPPEVREIVTFRAENSATYVDRSMTNNAYYDFVLVDGNHEYEFALFDVMGAARVMRPGGVTVMDNIEQIRPRLAAKTFLEGNPDWRCVADALCHIDLSARFKVSTASFPDTKFYDRAEVDGIELELAAPAQGVSTFSPTCGRST